MVTAKKKMAGRKGQTRSAAKSAKTAAKTPAKKSARAPAKQAAATPVVAKRNSTKKPTAPATSKVPASGPLTLDEARTLVVAKRPQAMARSAAAAIPPTTPGVVAQERERLRKVQDAELARRVRDYKATMAILKERGARSPARGMAPSSAGRAPAAAAAPAAFVPLQVLAEGDSWFDYPPHAFKGGLVPRLEKRLGVPILNLAKAGDEVRFMLGVKQYKLLAEHLANGCPAGGAWDALLFSGGGNDIVDEPMALWISAWNPAQPPAAHLNTARFAAALALVRAGFEELIALRNRLSADTQLVFHGYDYAIPDGRGVCFNAMGPWLKPAFDLRGFPTRQAGAEVVKLMLSEFAKMLQQLADIHPKVRFINSQGLLPADTGAWHNELHPASKGYNLHADKFRENLKELFPTRVV